MKNNEKWPYIPDHPYRILIIGGSGSGKTNTLLNLINEQEDIDKTYLYAKDLIEPKYEYLIKNRENSGIVKIILLFILILVFILISIKKNKKINNCFNHNDKHNCLRFT